MKLEINGYELTKKIYESAASLVFRGFRKKDHRYVILKQLKEDFPSPKEIIRYKQEFKIVKQITATRVIRGYDLLKYHHGLVLVLEDFNGISLQALLKTQQFSLKDKLYYSIEICKALGEIHHQNIIHQNISPDHIIINLATRTLKIIGFGLSTIFTRENPRLKAEETLAGDLFYQAPEQSGRMNRAVDYRADYYALGGILYLLFTGRPPFNEHDSLDLIYSHIAKDPIAPDSVNPDVPAIISAIILKLLAKNAEDRYQSTWGIENDLNKCLAQVSLDKPLAFFPLATEDKSAKFQLSQQLYGREQQVKTLQDNFRSVSQGSTIMLMVTGYSGVGKTTLIKELYRPVTGCKGYFISGKFNQSNKNTPYSAFITALSQLVNILLTEPKEKLSYWKKRISDTTCINGQLLITLIPEVELIIGKQQPTQQLDPKENENRVKLVLKNFVNLFCKAEHPLVIFIDDLQWLDMASIGLINAITLDKNTCFLYLICAYRKNDVSKSHVLTGMIKSLEEKSVNVKNLALTALSLENISSFLSDSLHTNNAKVTELAQLVEQKTLGNPFFMTQFVNRLHIQKLLNFSIKEKSWQWDIKKIINADITDNVVEFMIDKLKTLPEKTLEILKQASCIGNKFNIKPLAALSKTSVEQIYDQLLPAFQARLIQPLSEPELSNDKLINAHILIFKLKFLHDRVQQAAYSLLSPPEREYIHYNLGCILFEQVKKGGIDEAIFDRVAHLNIGSALILNPFGIIELIKLNIEAAEKARASGAYDTSAQLCQQAITLLPKNSWQSHFDLSFAVYIGLIKSEYLLKHFASATSLYPVVLEHADDKNDLLEIYVTQMMQANLSSDFTLALTAQQMGLNLLGIEFPENEEIAETLFLHELHKIKLLTKNSSEDELIAVSKTSSAEIKYAMKIMSYLWMTAYFLGRLNTASWVSVKMTHLSLQHGNNEYSSYGYMNYAFILNSVFHDYDEGSKFSRFAIQLAEKFDNHEIKGKVLMLFGVSEHWKKPLKNQEKTFASGFQYALNSGDFVTAGYNAIWLLINAFFSGKTFTTIKKEAVDSYHFYLEYDRANLDGLFYPFANMLLASLSGATCSALDIGETFNQSAFLTKYQNNPVYLGFYYSANLFRLCFLEERIDIDELSFQYQQTRIFNAGTSLVAFNAFHLCLILTANFNLCTEKEQQQKVLKQIETLNAQMENWSMHCPDNYRHKYLLMLAEYARISGETQDKVMQRYEDAIELLDKSDNIHYLATANKLYATYLLSKGHHKIAAMYLHEAIYHYQGWGFLEIISMLKNKYPQLIQARNQRELASLSITASPDNSADNNSGNIVTDNVESNSSLSFDIQTIERFHHALSQTSQMDKLLEKLICLTAENAGAQKGLLILKDQNTGQWLIEAEFTQTNQQINVLNHENINASTKVPISLLEYTIRTGKELILTKPHLQTEFSQDEYIRDFQPSSILCSALFNKGVIIGIIYLEHLLSTDIFSKEHLSTIKMIGIHAAILIENAMLNDDLETKVLARTKALTHKTEFISLISGLSRKFMALQPEELDKQITEFTATLGDYCQLNNIYIYLYTVNRKILKISYSWHRQTPKKPQDILVRNHLNFEHLIQENDCFHFRTLADIPSSSSDFKAQLQQNNFLSGVIVKLTRKTQLLGFIAFDSSANSHRWTDDEINLLNVCGEVLAKTLDNTKQLKQLPIMKDELFKVTHELNNKIQLDGLTGIHNRLFFDEQFPLELRRARRNSRYLSLLMLDIDHFQRYNDSYGHIDADEALITTARSIQKLLKRAGESVARYDGEKFIIILPETGAQRAQKIATELCKTVQALNITHHSSDVAPVLTVSLGIATALVTALTSEQDFIATADNALYLAKTNGRNCSKALELEL